jgi:Holliday junction resolvase RusA-like endonuclease
MDNAIRIKFFEKPMGKERPRHFYHTGAKKVITTTPPKTRIFERKLARAARIEMKKSGKKCFEKNVPLRVSITAYFPILKSENKIIKEKKISGEILPTKKPDADNIAKIVLDALNGVCFVDDNQVCVLSVAKMYCETPSIEVKISDYPYN